MPLMIQYPHDVRTGLPVVLSPAAVRAIAGRVRRQIVGDHAEKALDAVTLAGACRRIDVNGRGFDVAWDFEHPVHDETGVAVLGVCETDPDMPGMAYVSINRQMIANRPDVAVSTAAHELGHLVFDVPAVGIGPGRRYRSVTQGIATIDRATRRAEARANEFMGAVLAPPVLLHTRLLAHAREEHLRLTRSAHHGRPGSPVVAADNAPDAIAGIVAALAAEFGVSDRFIAVRLGSYGLIEGGIA